MPFFSLWESLRFSFGGKIGAKTTLGKALISTKNVAWFQHVGRWWKNDSNFSLDREKEPDTINAIYPPRNESISHLTGTPENHRRKSAGLKRDMLLLMENTPKHPPLGCFWNHVNKWGLTTISTGDTWDFWTINSRESAGPGNDPTPKPLHGVRCWCSWFLKGKMVGKPLGMV